MSSRFPFAIIHKACKGIFALVDAEGECHYLDGRKCPVYAKAYCETCKAPAEDLDTELELVKTVSE